MLAPIPHGSPQAIRLQGAALSLTEGSQVTARVLQQLGSGRFLLSVNGKNFSAESRLPLLPGQSLRVQVQSSQGTVFLRLSGAQNTPITAFLRSEGLAQDRLAQSVVQAFMRSGLPLEPNAIRTARRFFGQRAESDQRLIRLYAIARDKGIELGHSELDELSLLLDGEGAERDQGRRKEADRRSRQSALKSQPTEPEREGRGSDHKAGNQVSASESPALALFNHLPGREGHWIVLPISLQGDEASVAGSLRVLLESSTDSLRFACIAVRSKSLEFEVAWTKGSRVAHLYSFDTERAAAYEWQVLECVKPLGIREISVVDRGKEWDGFATELYANIIQGVDERA